MKHLLDITQLKLSNVEQLLTKAMDFKKGIALPNYSSYRLANLFYENSTRTRISFELAAKNLAIPVVNFDLAHSSESKGEMIEDTVSNLTAMGINLFVIRHTQEQLQHQLAQKIGNTAHIINAGDGQHAHPSQALLDYMTIRELKSGKLKVAIIGDILHSRVANSLQCLFALMDIGELVMVAPEIWQPKHIHYGRVTSSLREGLEKADVIICLRVQQERLLDNEQLNLVSYRKQFALTQESLSLAKANAIVMHPGPVNRGIEIDADIVDGARLVILQQVKNGVFMRMAIIDSLLSSSPD